MSVVMNQNASSVCPCGVGFVGIDKFLHEVLSKQCKSALRSPRGYRLNSSALHDAIIGRVSRSALTAVLCPHGSADQSGNLACKRYCLHVHNASVIALVDKVYKYFKNN